MSHITNRIKSEIQKLYNANYEIELKDGNTNEFDLYIDGPVDSPFYGARYKVHFVIPNDYPFKSPSIGFVTKIFHPNVDENSGSICLDVLNQVWTPLYDLMNVVEIFLPQLLTYPNPNDPLNCEAGILYINDLEKYKRKVEEYKEKYAIKSNSKIKSGDSDSLSSLSDDSIDL